MKWRYNVAIHYSENLGWLVEGGERDRGDAQAPLRHRPRLLHPGIAQAVWSQRRPAICSPPTSHLFSPSHLFTSHLFTPSHLFIKSSSQMKVVNEIAVTRKRLYDIVLADLTPEEGFTHQG